MCRFVMYLGEEITLSSLITEPEHSIIHQSYESKLRSEPLNGDGFGVAWFADSSDSPAVFRDVSPAWSNENLRELARVVRSRCVLAHVRAATPGLAVTQLNCHPFVHGNYAFMHNGSVSCFPNIRRHLLQSLSDSSFDAVRGTTDSEVLFGLLLDILPQLNQDDPLEALYQAVNRCIRSVESLCDAGDESDSVFNLAITDGQHSVVTRYATPPTKPESLYYTSGTAFECVNGRCRVAGTEGGEQKATIIASEPLSEVDQWYEVPANHAVLISAGKPVELRPITT